ncbi:MAG: hydroxymethylglutaryl-CoA reductase [Candidatus Marinimicrobia bacterium]|nr:hydroxymethylglutaryl-CoA reductase [Candidatus Neomarinimicrobiota bacterium]
MAKSKNGNNNRIPRGYEPEDTERRLKWLKEEKGIDFKDPPVNEPEDLKGIIENHIGFMKLPMAITGPLLVDGQYAQGEFVVPISTLEGTLALSMSRGMYATFASGGIRVRHVKQELSRAPVFFFDNINDSFEFMDWVNKHKDKIIETAESTTRFGKVLRIDQYPIQNYLILDFVLDTKNAAGQNMVTLAAKTACDYIKEETGYNYMVESNFNSDKKASTRNMILGRGHSIVAETVLKNSVLKRVLGITADLVQKLQRPGPTISAMAGTTGTHLHISNALTSIYLATGQDTACVSENSIGHFQTEPAENNGLACRLTLPSLTVGTVGGGTRLLPQKQNLEMLGCDGGEYSSRKLAEIIGASTLALEISLMSALASDTFTGSHMKYGRE